MPPGVTNPSGADPTRIDMRGRVCVVTGATRGIGRPTAAGLAALGATVVVHGRDAVAVDRVVGELSAETGNKRISGVAGRFDSLADVRRIAAEIIDRHPRLDVLINNAGAGPLHRRTTTGDGFEWIYGVNHLAPFLLTSLLLERLRESAPARIVTVASRAHRRAALDLDDPSREQRPYRGRQAYADSKLANILFTRELASRLAGSGVTANCLHPGVVATSIFSGFGLAGRAFALFARPGLLSPREGARVSIRLATAPDLEQVSGQYFDASGPAPTTAAGRDMALARRLWDSSAAQVGITAAKGKAARQPA